MTYREKMFDPGNFFRKINEKIFSVCYSGGFATPAHHLAAIVGSDLCREPSCFFSAIYIYISLYLLLRSSIFSPTANFSRLIRVAFCLDFSEYFAFQLIFAMEQMDHVYNYQSLAAMHLHLIY
jgi:hypothetical protein